MASVAHQVCRDFEYVVVDGLSSDGSREVIANYESLTDHLICEKDSGLYEAMNKGSKIASGEYLLFLNSGDWLCDDGVVGRLLEAVDGDADIYYSDLTVSDGFHSTTIRYPSHVDVNYFVGATISHQNSLIRRSLLLRAGLYREDFRISSDWYFFLYASHELGASFRHIETRISIMEPGGIGNDPTQDAKRVEERRQTIVNIFGPIAPTILELLAYRESKFGYIVRSFGFTGLLGLFLDGYRFLARRLPIMRSGKNFR